MNSTKIAVVTGGGSGIGEGICKRLACDDIMVIVTDIDLNKAKVVKDIICSAGGNADAMQLDVTDEKSINEVIQNINTKHGCINYWINNAGISKITPFLNHTNDLWDQTMNINLKSQFLCCKEVIPQMIKNGYGSIVNMSSQSGKVGTNDYQAYCSSKFGVIGLTQSLAKEFGEKGIRVNAVCPGVVYTPMWDNQKYDYATKKGMNPEDVMDYFKSKIPLKRLGTTEDVANVESFLLGEQSSYITGQAINVNGGDIMF